jgi:hypothetical protein
LRNAFLALLCCAGNGGAQVIISPAVVLFADNERLASVAVRNVSGVPQEVSLGFRFGYPESDSAGNYTVRYDDAAAAGRYSMSDWVRAFPRQFVLPPGAEQVVRLVAQPPAGLADGAYWTRMAVASQPRVAVADQPGRVAAQVVVRLEQITSVIYRRGQLTSAVSLGEITTHSENGGRYLLVPLSRTGSAPFVGSLSLVVRLPDGSSVARVQVPVLVYFNSVHRVRLPPEAWQSGVEHNVLVTVTAGREDLARKRLPATAPVTTRVAYTPH